MDIVDGKVVYDGRTLVEWVPDVVADLVEECDPLQAILFASVARGDDGPDTDLDLLVVLPKVEQSERHELMGRLRGAVKAVIPIDVIVTDPGRDRTTPGRDRVDAVLAHASGTGNA